MIEALLELQYAEPSRAKAFDCNKCPSSVKKLRRCEEERTFTSDDGNIWPMRISEGGTLFGFCPGKAQKNAEAVMIYRSLIITAETGLPYQSGGIDAQPYWWVELASWFVPRYNELRFYSRTKAILGDGKGVTDGGVKRISRIPNSIKNR